MLLTGFFFLLSAVIAASELISTIGCERKEVSLKCESGGVISVNSANYGRVQREVYIGSEKCNANGVNANLNCRSSKSMTKVSEQCDGKTDCVVKASNSVFGDPCRGTNKYLNVTYTCSKEHSDIDLGCWKNRKPTKMQLLEGTDQRLRPWHYKQRTDAVSKCLEVAKDQGYARFAVGNKGQCWACWGDEYKLQGEARSCPMHGKGQYAVINVYGLSEPTTTPPPPPPTTTTSGKCGGRIWDSKGIITSPGFPHKYPANKECTWILNAENNKHIRVKFSDFYLTPSKDCQYDRLEIRNGGSPISPLIGTYCGNDDIYEFSSNSEQVFIRFVSVTGSAANRAAGSGFKLDFDTDNDCYSQNLPDYNGTLITTQTGTLCQHWDSNSPHKTSSTYTAINRFPESTLSDVNNYCRTSDWGYRPWCYTSNPSQEWDYCDVPECKIR